MEETKREFEEISPATWTPNTEEDQVEGRFINMEEGKGINESNAYYLEKDGTQILIWGTTVLNSRMKFAQLGEYLRITYKGKEKNKKGQDIKIFKVERATGLK